MNSVAQKGAIAEYTHYGYKDVLLYFWLSRILFNMGISMEIFEGEVIPCHNCRDGI